MRGVLLEVPEALLEERRRLGLDERDEMWEGVLHMVPPADGPHQRFGTRLIAALLPPADRRGLEASYETGFYNHDQDYKVPDHAYSKPEHLSTRGVEGAELVVEIKSPSDETYEKLDWYAARGVGEVLVVHPAERRVELFRAGERVEPVDGTVTLETLGVTLETVEGPLLRLTWDGGSAEV